MIYDYFPACREPATKMFFSDCMTVLEEFLEIKKLHLSPKQSALMYKWRKKSKILDI